MSNLNYNTTLQSNNTDLQAILSAINELPEASGSREVEDAIITRTMTSYTNNRITSIGAGAFAYFYYLASVSFPACTTISCSAFTNCSHLTSVSFPACTFIGYSAFEYCRNLTSVSFPACTSIAWDVFMNCHNLTSVSFPACTSIGGWAFRGCSNLTSVSFPACTFIGASAFYSCRSLSQFYLTGSSICTLSNSNAFALTPYAGWSSYFSGTPHIYVPSSLIASYQTATNWAYFSSYFSAIEDASIE